MNEGKCHEEEGKLFELKRHRNPKWWDKKEVRLRGYAFQTLAYSYDMNNLHTIKFMCMCLEKDERKMKKEWEMLVQADKIHKN